MGGIATLAFAARNPELGPDLKVRNLRDLFDNKAVQRLNVQMPENRHQQ
jgi:hypothetical protein